MPKTDRLVELIDMYDLPPELITKALVIHLRRKALGKDKSSRNSVLSNVLLDEYKKVLTTEFSKLLDCGMSVSNLNDYVVHALEVSLSFNELKPTLTNLIDIYHGGRDALTPTATFESIFGYMIHESIIDLDPAPLAPFTHQERLYDAFEPKDNYRMQLEAIVELKKSNYITSEDARVSILLLNQFHIGYDVVMDIYREVLEKPSSNLSRKTFSGLLAEKIDCTLALDGRVSTIIESMDNLKPNSLDYIECIENIQELALNQRYFDN